MIETWLDIMRNLHHVDLFDVYVPVLTPEGAGVVAYSRDHYDGPGVGVILLDAPGAPVEFACFDVVLNLRDPQGFGHALRQILGVDDEHLPIVGRWMNAAMAWSSGTSATPTARMASVGIRWRRRLTSRRSWRRGTSRLAG